VSFICGDWTVEIRARKINVGIGACGRLFVRNRVNGLCRDVRL
jgi:hypothetical protein